MAGFRATGRQWLLTLPALAALLGLASCANNAGDVLPAAECPQPRFTETAPEEFLRLQNPLADTRENLQAGERIYRGGAGASCSLCHGRDGDGRGSLARRFDPQPRNFACAATVNGIPDGQLFWIIRYGSPGTSMPSHPTLDDTRVWQLVLHLRQLAR